MIQFWTLLAAIVLLLLLLGLATKGWLGSRQLREASLGGNEEDMAEPCPEEFVAKVFSRADWEFVRDLELSGIERLFQEERKKVALVWVRQISASIGRVMRQHAQAARQSKNLRVFMEFNILAQFLSLLALCGTLAVAIRISGPVPLGGLAHLAQNWSQQLSNLQNSFQARASAKARSAGVA